MQDIYQKNINYLDDRFINLLSNYKDFSRNLNLVTSKTGELTLEVELDNEKQVLLHSRYDPVKGAEKFIANYDVTKNKNIVLVGFGLGYHAEQILNKLDANQNLKIIIPSIDIFKVSLKNRDLTHILKDERAELIIESNYQFFIERLQDLFNRIKIENSKLIFPQQLVKVIPDEFLGLKDILEDIRLNNWNQKRVKDKVHRNIINNVEFINESIGIKEFKDVFNEVPIFIVSAGPSLDKNISQLKNIGNKGVIIVVDTAITPLLNKKIKPDFIVTIESIEAGYNKIFKELPELEIPLLYSMGTHNKIVKNYLGHKIVGLSQKDLIMDRLNEIVKKGRLHTGGSVASAALDFAFKLGGNPIIFVGQDFAFDLTTDKTHSTETFYEEQKQEVSLLKKVDGINGKDVFTSKAYYSYLRWFERYIRNNQDVTYIDASEGGAKIAGTKIMKLQEVIKKYCREFIDKKEIIRRVIQEYDFEKNKMDIEKLKRLVKEL